MKAKTQKSAPANGRKRAAKSAPPEARNAARRATETASAAPAETRSEIAGFGQGNLAAVVHANAAMVKGFEEIGQEVFGYAQHSLESAVNAAQAMMGARSLVDVIALNRDFVQSALESFLTESARLSEIGIKTASEAFAPLGLRSAETQAKIDRPTVA
jgi:phasin family protein